MTKGFTGRIVHVDLTARKSTVEQPQESFYRRYGGGSAMGTHYLLKGMPAGADPLGAENILTVFVGPATGAPISGQSRVSVCAKSPLTGGAGDSQAGGFWPAFLKRSGFDGLVITGRAAEPVYLWLHDGKVEFREADHLWGKITGETERLIREELGDEKAQVMQIGPAGEKLVRFACIINMSNRANGRTGMGAVMGSKNLKAIVLQGGQGPEFFDSQKIKELARWGADNFKDSNTYELGLHGTANVIPGQNDDGGLPTRNWSSGVFEDYEKISGQTMSKTILKERDTCFGCVIRCKRVVEVTKGGFQVDPYYGGPEYESISTLGSYCGINDLPAIAKANELCNKFGLDTISCGATIAWAMDCYERGVISKTATGGLELNFGNTAAMVRLVEQIAGKEGFGALLAEGSARAAEKFGSEAQRLVVTAKKQEFPAHMPQVKRSLALIYAVNPCGADHMSSDHDPMYEPDTDYAGRMAEIGLLDPQPARELGPEKVRFAHYTQWIYSACNSLCLCQFVYGPSWQLYSTGQMAEVIRAATGWEFNVFELMKLGERTVNLQRAFNAREGFSAENDVLPEKISQPLKGGESDGAWIPADQIETAKTLYYQMCGWSREGIPSRAKLEELGIGWAADLMEEKS
ncbi:MAG: aldehyde ferredoxin oxidoreductase family protein [Spirochaetaceae bacterium]|nr:MAG: aldehyde ferredoxin oxidoreductase family protein [Spirochaetaceae bacterium]